MDARGEVEPCLVGVSPQLEVLRAATGAEPVEPTAVLLPTRYGEVKVDVLEIRPVEIDRLSGDPCDRLHVMAHAWAIDTATDLTLEVIRADGERVEVSTPVAQPGQLSAMKLQAVMNRSAAKAGTDLLDVVRLTLDEATGPDIGSARAEPWDLRPATASGHLDDPCVGVVGNWFGCRRAVRSAWLEVHGVVDSDAPGQRSPGRAACPY